MIPCNVSLPYPWTWKSIYLLPNPDNRYLNFIYRRWLLECCPKMFVKIGFYFILHGYKVFVLLPLICMWCQWNATVGMQMKPQYSWGRFRLACWHPALIGSPWGHWKWSLFSTTRPSHTWLLYKPCLCRNKVTSLHSPKSWCARGRLANVKNN